MAVDIRTEEQVLSYIPERHRHRVHHVHRDIRDMTYAQLCAMLVEIGCPVARVAHLHASPPCTTHSEAHHSHNFHRDGITPLTANSVTDDDLTKNLCNLMRNFAADTGGIFYG